MSRAIARSLHFMFDSLFTGRTLYIVESYEEVRAIASLMSCCEDKLADRRHDAFCVCKRELTVV